MFLSVILSSDSTKFTNSFSKAEGFEAKNDLGVSLVRFETLSRKVAVNSAASCCCSMTQSLSLPCQLVLNELIKRFADGALLKVLSLISTFACNIGVVIRVKMAV